MFIPQVNGLPTSGLSGSATNAANETAKIGLFGGNNNLAAISGGSLPSATLPEKKIEEVRSKKLLRDMSPLTFPLDLSPDYYISFNAFIHSQERPQEAKRSFTFDKSVYLPLPANISDSYSASYDAENLYVLGNATKNAINSLMVNEGGGTASVQNIMQNIPNQAGALAANVMDKIAKDPMSVAKKAAATALTYGMSGIGGPLAAAAKSAFQVTTNPFPVMIFQGAGLKPPFSFEWTLYPESLQESQAIKKIIGYFREMLPELMEGNQSILKTPAVFEIKMVPDLDTRKFKRCVLTDMSVNYAPNGIAFIKDNFDDPSNAAVPAAISISLTFKEIEVWLADDFSTSEAEFFEPKNKIPPPPPQDIAGVQGEVANSATRGVASGTPFGM